MEVIFKIEDKPFAGGFSDERLKVNALLVKKQWFVKTNLWKDGRNLCVSKNVQMNVLTRYLSGSVFKILFKIFKNTYIDKHLQPAVSGLKKVEAEEDCSKRAD